MTIDLATNGKAWQYTSRSSSRACVLVRERSGVRDPAAAPATSTGCAPRQAKIDSAPKVQRNSEAGLPPLLRLEYSKAPPLTQEVRTRIREGVLSLEWDKGLVRGSKNGSPWRSIYVVECNGFVKVGYASDLQARMAGMMVDNPSDLRLCWHREVPAFYAFIAERGAHRGLVDYRHRNEWFTASPAYAAKVVTASCQVTRRVIGLRQTAVAREDLRPHSRECAVAWLREVDAFLASVPGEQAEIVAVLAKRAVAVRRNLRERGIIAGTPALPLQAEGVDPR